MKFYKVYSEINTFIKNSITLNNIIIFYFITYILNYKCVYLMISLFNNNNLCVLYK